MSLATHCTVLVALLALTSAASAQTPAKPSEKDERAEYIRSHYTKFEYRIPMRDGARLAARIWRPDTTEQRPLPAILEYIPYRKLDFTRIRDEITSYASR